MFKYFLGIIALIIFALACSPSYNKINTGSFEPIKAKEDSTYFLVVQEMPEPLNGISDIEKNLVYTQQANDAGIEGKVFVLAYITTTGDVEKVTIIKGLGYGLDESAINAIKKTKFKPGKHKGKPVKVQISIPIMFTLD